MDTVTLTAFYPLIADADVGMGLVLARDRAVRLAERELSLSPMSYVTSFVERPVFTKPPSGLYVRGPTASVSGFTGWRHSLQMPFFGIVVAARHRKRSRRPCMSFDMCINTSTASAGGT